GPTHIADRGQGASQLLLPPSGKELRESVVSERGGSEADAPTPRDRSFFLTFRLSRARQLRTRDLPCKGSGRRTHGASAAPSRVRVPDERCVCRGVVARTAGWLRRAKEWRWINQWINA